MTDEYIRKADAVDELRFKPIFSDAWNALGEARDRIKAIKPADVAPVVHGRWIDTDSHLGYFANCSACGYQMDVHAERGYFNFCPNCGAKMDAQIEE